MTSCIACVITPRFLGNSEVGSLQPLQSVGMSVSYVLALLATVRSSHMGETRPNRRHGS